MIPDSRAPSSPAKEYYGCAAGAESYHWCEVDPSSCPSHDFLGPAARFLSESRRSVASFGG